MRKVYFILFLLATQHAVAQWQYTGTKIFYDAGNVGIGYSDPIDKLHVHGSAFIFGHIRLGQQQESMGQGNMLIFNDHGNSDPLWMARYNAATNASELRVNLGDEGDNDKFVIGFTENSTSTWAPKFTFLANGKAGIGTNNPQDLNEKLNVNGNIHIGDFTTGIYNSGANALIRVNERFTLQSTVTPNNQWTRGTMAQNIQWNNTIQKWDIPGSTSDFAMWKYESNGNVSLYTNTNTSSPYSLDETELQTYKRIWITGDGRISMGKMNNSDWFKLSVEGKVSAKEVKVTINGWADHVFNKGYKLMSLASLEAFIKKNNHLPNIPSEQEVKDNGGIDLGDMNKRLLEKIEELTLHVIALNKEIQQLKKENAASKK